MSRTSTALLAGISLAAGFAIAQTTGVRALGGAVLLVALFVCGRGWLARSGPLPTAVLVLAFVGLFVASHVLTLALGVPAWGSVASVAVAMTVTAYAVDRGRPVPAA